MTSDKARKSAVRQRMADTGEPYCVAARAMDQAPAIDPALLKPYADEQDTSAEELGWRVLPADATPAQRAHAEAFWRPVSAERPCRCSGDCYHGQPCGDEGDEDRCPGRLVHVDRYPGSMWAVTVWEDVYQCEECEATSAANATLPAVPWGEATENGCSTYPKVRHPGFREIDEDTPRHPAGDGSCRGCGSYALSGLLCDGCRANGWTDDYGYVEEPDDDDHGCPECGARGRNGDPYAECECLV